MPLLSRQDMEALLLQGGSVLYRGRVITREVDLPTLAELAQGDPVAETAAVATLQEQIDRLQAQLATLTIQSTLGAGDQSPATDQEPVSDQEPDPDEKKVRK